MTDKELARQMKRDWNERAKRDPLFWTHAAVPGEGLWSLDDYMVSGEQAVAQFLDPFLAQSAIAPGDLTCLEIGCGAGRLVRALAQRFGMVVGLDISSKMIAEAQSLCADLPHVYFVEGNGLDLGKVQDSSMDFVFSALCFGHIPSVAIQMGYLKETARVLRPGGHYLIELYGNVAEGAILKEEWEKRRQANDLMGWSPLAKLALANYETWTRTAVEPQTVYPALTDSNMILEWEQGQGTESWWIGGSFVG